MSFIAGRYTGTHNSNALGICDNEAGIALEWQQFAEDVTGDNYAQTIQDQIYQGAALEAMFTLLEADSAALAGLENPMGTGYALGTPGVPMVAASKVKAVVLTAVAGTSAYGGAGSGGQSGGTPATITIYSACLAPGFPVRKVFNTKLRRIPIRLRCFPYNNSGTITFASQT